MSRQRHAVAQPWCRFGVWGTGTYPPGEQEGLRKHLDHDLIWIVEGEVGWEFDGVACPAPAPCVLLARPGMTDRITWDPRRSSRNAYVHFTPVHLPPHVPPDHLWPRCTRLPPEDTVTPMLRHLLRLLADRPRGWEALSASALAHAIGSVCQGSLTAGDLLRGSLGPAATTTVAQLASWWGRGGPRIGGLAVHAAPPLSALAIGRGCSREAFCRAFRAEIGIPPLVAVRALRLERAAALLRRTDLPAEQVGALCGFADPFHFSRSFRANFGMTAGRFRVQQGLIPRLAPPGSSEAFAAFRRAVRAALPGF